MLFSRDATDKLFRITMRYCSVDTFQMVRTYKRKGHYETKTWTKPFQAS